ncbi:MAG: ProQ/FINO family protein [Zoogloeaceae bacterium]|jgi:ProP effector|nr:ProQ/FINO family protein [Zoogloeaceae bacterium]
MNAEHSPIESQETTPLVQPETAPPAETPTDAPPAFALPALPDEAKNDPKALLTWLRANVPAFKDTLPLAIGTDRVLKQALPEVSKKILRTALALHTHSTRYLKATLNAETRFHLDATPGGELPDSHKEHARELLKVRREKQIAARREQAKAEREAAKAQREAEKARIHANKLAQLAEKFSPGKRSS